MEKEDKMSFQEKKDGMSVKAPISLVCEYTSNPLGIDVTPPRFSWMLNHSERGQLQSAYQVLVASSKANLDVERGDQWDSGKVISEESINVVYAGSALESGKTYYWKVRFWDKDGQVSPYSETATFEMGLLNSGDWKGKWIKGGNLLRKKFILGKEIKRARAYICGLGYYELRVNGEKVGQHVLDPGWTDYDKRTLYVTYDMTNYLKVGENTVGVMLGNGRYSPPDETLDKIEHSPKKYNNSPVLIGQINIELTDGSNINIITDETWKVAQGPIVSDDIYDGEIHDARWEKSGWDTPSYDDAEWNEARIAPAPGGKLVSQASFPPIKAVRIIQPRAITNPHPEVYVYDFGQNFAGWVRLCVSGPEGTKVKLRYAELLHKDGTINTNTNRKAKATDIYILKGEGKEVYEPHFTYHGFRYVEVNGFPGTPTLENLEGRVVNSAVEPVGGFICSNPLINHIHRNILWGQLSNLMSVPTDCPQRAERQGWMGDAQLTAEEAIYNFDMAGFYTKWVEDISDSQAEDGSIPDVVPPYWSLYPADPAWGAACIVIPWYLYQYYGDKRVLKECYLLIKGWVDFLTSSAENYIISYSKYGDWVAPGYIRPEGTPGKSGKLISTWYYYFNALMLSRIANILERADDVKKYSELSDKIKQAFNREFLKENRYSGEKYSDFYRKVEASLPRIISENRKKEVIKELLFGLPNPQTCNILPLFLNIVPEDKKEAVLKNLIDDIVVTHNSHLNTGMIGTRYILDVLTKYGQANLAYKLVTQATYPGWGYMIQEGATTLWERWEYLDGMGMNSHNHPTFGSVDAWFYKVLAGINIDPAGPGFRKVIIKPYVIGNLDYVSASIKTIRGMVSSSWKKNSPSLTLNVTLPVNTEAKVSIPKMKLGSLTIKESGKIVWEDGSYLEGVAGITGASEDDEYVTFNVGSGSYSFEVRGQKIELRR